MKSPKLWKNRLSEGHRLPTGRFNLWRDLRSCGDCIILINYLERTHELSAPSDYCVPLSLGVLIFHTPSTPWGVPPPFLLTRPREKRGSTSHRWKRTNGIPATQPALSCWFCLLLPPSPRLRWQKGGFVTRQPLSREDACLLTSCLSLPPQPRQSLRHSGTTRR